MRNATQLGQRLSIVGVALTTAYQGGTPVGLLGTHELDVEVLAAFDAATALTSITFRLEVSDDGVNWEPIPFAQASAPGTALVSSAALAASAGNTVRDRLTTTAHRNAAQVRVVAKCSAGGSKAGDAATANVNFSEEGVL